MNEPNEREDGDHFSNTEHPSLLSSMDNRDGIGAYLEEFQAQVGGRIVNGEQHDPDHGDALSVSEEASEITASPAPAPNSRGMGPEFDAMRGDGVPLAELGIPGITIHGADGVLRPPSHASDVPTERAERLTISDRGDLLYSQLITEEPNRQTLNPDIARVPEDGDVSLLTKLFVLRQRSKTKDGPWFFPRGQVEALITEDVVFETIEEEKSKLKKILKKNEPMSDAEIRQYAEAVCRSGYRKIFAILVMLERGWEIVLFVDDKLCDSDLPLLAQPVESNGCLVEMRRRDAPEVRLACCRNWTPKTHEDFDKEQWGLISPFFARGKLRRAHFYELSKKDILPWIKEDGKLHQGGYASISRIQIHPNHHNFEKNELSDGTFAVKHFTTRSHPTSTAGTVGVPEPGSDLSPPGHPPLPSPSVGTSVGPQELILSNGTSAAKHFTTTGSHPNSTQGTVVAAGHSFGSSPPEPPPPSSLSVATSVSPQVLKKEFEREIEILNRFSGDDHPHLISLLTAFRHGDEYCLLFRWAEADLKAFWANNKPGSALDKSNLLWMFEQCCGIASGLQRIHVYQTTNTRTQDSLGDGRLFGRHGDIKPENILLFRKQNDPNDRGTLVITDFGLTKFHHDNTKTYFSAREVPATLTYQPPECDMENCKISRSFDIWSFGCVLLEFITWQLGGWEYVQEFVDFRKSRNILLFGWKTDHFYEIVRQGNQEKLEPSTVLVRVKIEIHEFVNKLHAHPDCSEVFHELLNFIMQKMLVIESVNLGQRAQCYEVYKKLEDLYQKLKRSDYEIKANPWKVAPVETPEAVEMPLNLEGVRMMSSRHSDLKPHTGKTRRIVLLKRSETEP